MAILMGDGAWSKHDAIDERCAECPRGIYGASAAEKLFAPDNLGNINRHEWFRPRVSGKYLGD